MTIKIALLGTVHFTPSDEDDYKNEIMDLGSRQKQLEIDDVIDSLVSFNPRKIFIEATELEQDAINRDYEDFLKGQHTLRSTEIDQIAFKLGKKLNLTKLNCVNYLGDYDSNLVKEFARNNGQEVILADLDLEVSKFLSEIKEKQLEGSMLDLLIFLNGTYALDKNASIYTKYYIKIGNDRNYIGADLIAEWYKTNLYIYSNILRNIGRRDEAILVLYGQGHIPVLSHFFRSNSDFELIDITKILNRQKI